MTLALDGYLSDSEVASEFGVSIRTLRRWEKSRIGPQPIRFGRKTIYRVQTIQEWLAKKDEAVRGNTTRRDHVGALSRLESNTKKQLVANGWRVLRNGWPDFLCINESSGEIVGVEVKGWHDPVQEHQKEIHEVLHKSGLPVVVVRRGEIETEKVAETIARAKKER